MTINIRSVADSPAATATLGAQFLPHAIEWVCLKDGEVAAEAPDPLHASVTSTDCESETASVCRTGVG